MELVYMWIGRYANISKKGFNFSNQYYLHHDGKILHVRKNAHEGIRIFDDSFLNITAIAGENGSGKTSLLSFIENVFILFLTHIDEINNYDATTVSYH